MFYHNIRGNIIIRFCKNLNASLRICKFVLLPPIIRLQHITCIYPWYFQLSSTCCLYWWHWAQNVSKGGTKHATEAWSSEYLFCGCNRTRAGVHGTLIGRRFQSSPLQDVQSTLPCHMYWTSKNTPRDPSGQFSVVLEYSRRGVGRPIF